MIELELTIKEKSMLEHYKELIEKSEFDEYDIYGFLVFVREYLPKGKWQLIKEIADTFVHRKKDKGIVYKNITNCINNKYLERNSKLVGYQGISDISWCKQWKEMMNYFGISVLSKTLREIQLCIFSLLQNIVYIKDKQKIGVFKIIFNDKNNQIALCTTEDNKESPFAVFSVIDHIIYYMNVDAISKDAIEVIRENGKLVLKIGDNIICSVK